MGFRLEKVNSLLAHELSEIFLREMEFPPNVLVSVTHAEVAEDLKQVKIFISVMPFKEGRTILGLLDKNIFRIQQALNKRLKMRRVPKIVFKIDPSIDQAARVEKLLAEDEQNFS